LEQEWSGEDDGKDDEGEEEEDGECVLTFTNKEFAKGCDSRDEAEAEAADVDVDVDVDAEREERVGCDDEVVNDCRSGWRCDGIRLCDKPSTIIPCDENDDDNCDKGAQDDASDCVDCNAWGSDTDIDEGTSSSAVSSMRSINTLGLCCGCTGSIHCRIA
jgi:hypothetical protein